MIAALDVHYEEDKSVATAAAVVFAGWGDAASAAEYVTIVAHVQPYVPGEFFRRELPCLTAVIGTIRESIDMFIVDAYVRLGGKPGLGQYLFEHFQRRIPVIGVAKTSFHDAVSEQVIRGGSKLPLYVTAIGCDPVEAASRINQMHGPYRVRL